MHRTIDYSNLSGKEKQDKAVKDVRGYLTAKQFKGTKELAQSDCTYEKFEFLLGLMCGIQGYPVEALWLYFGRELPKTSDEVNPVSTTE